MARKSLFRKDIIGWSMYDFANTIFSMNIISRYLKLYIVDDLGKDDRYFDIPFALSMLLAALLLPALGAVSDYSTKKKFFLFLFTMTCCISIGLMAFVPSSMFIILIVLFIISNFSYEAGQPFYNSLLYSVAEGKDARFVSGIGVALGYVGSVFGLIIVMPFVTGSVFNFNISFIDGGGRVASFIPTAFLFALFALPLFLTVKEKEVKVSRKVSLAEGYKDVWNGIKSTKKYPGVLRFLIADYFFEDAVTTVIINIGVFCSVVIGLEDSEIDMFLIISTISAVAGSFILGKIAQHYSLKKMLHYIILGWIISLLCFVFTESQIVVWILGSVVGILLGGLWTTSRPMLGELVPHTELGKFFGLFSLSGRAAAVIGPLVWTTVVYMFNTERLLGAKTAELLQLSDSSLKSLPYKAGIISLILMMTLGLYIFRKVPSHPEQETNA